MQFERQSENLLKENASFYKSQIEELEKMILDLNQQLQDSKENQRKFKVLLFLN